MTTNQLVCEQIHNLIGLSKSSRKLLLQALNDRELSCQNENFIVFYRYVFPKFSNIEKARELLNKHAENIESNIRKLEK